MSVGRKGGERGKRERRRTKEGDKDEADKRGMEAEVGKREKE